jgi:AcrR family transcriptional regulator
MSQQMPDPARPDAPGGDKPLRADARRNRARVLEAAETVFAAKGTGASTEEVAREAGVGIGTVFRHFPTKEALLEAVFAARLERLAEDARALAAAEDPGAALFNLFTRMVQESATKQALADALAAAGVDVRQQVATAGGQELLGALGVLLTRAQEAGAVRSDLRPADLIALLVGTSKAAEHTGWDPETHARTLRVVLDGLRPGRPG